MALINTAGREIQCKLVYYGIGQSGKTSNVQYIFQHSPSESRGQFLSVATEQEMTLFFDFLPLDFGLVHGFHVRFHLYTVPGQIRYERTHAAVLQGADGVVFVADSHRDRLEENYGGLVELEANMHSLGRDMAEFPLVLQWNKRDVPDALSVAVLERYLNRRGVPTFEATAITGMGVFPTLRTICKHIMARL
ncbi:MAG: GTPase domain-containing protein [Ktedonobacterales bacterium]|nr:GTPase domain-containing protein [Ktedonobacterales bacterium]